MTRVMVTSTKAYLCFILTVLSSAKSAGDIPTVTVIAPKNALPGINVQFQCIDSTSSTGSHNNVTFQWLKDNDIVPKGNKHILSIHNVSFADEGDYSCRIIKNGSVSSSSATYPFSLIVPPQLQIKQAKGGRVLQIAEGSNLFLTCNIINSPTPSVSRDDYWWTFLPMDGRCLEGMTSGADSGVNTNCTGGQKVNLSSNAWLKIDGAEKRFELHGTSVNRSQSGNYTCNASNDPFINQSIPSGTAAIYVQVQYLDQPVVISPSTTQTVVAGDNFTLTCQVDSLPTATLTWLHRGRILHTVKRNEDVFSFPARGSEDSGEYQCRAHNEAVNKTASHGIQIAVEYPPTRVGSGSLSKETELSGREGDDLTLSVNASGNPPPVYAWLGPAPMTGQGSSSVTLHQLLPVDAGIYTVNVSNVHGSFLHTFHVTVLPADQVNAPTAAIDSTAWMTGIGGVLLFLIILSIVLLILVKCRGLTRKRARQTQEAGLQMESSTAGPPDSSSRRRRVRRDGGGTPHQEPSDRVPREHGDAGVKVVARVPYPRDGGESGETTAFIPPPLEPTAPEETDPVPAPPPYSLVAGISMRLYPWAAIEPPENTDSAVELEDKYGLPKNLHLPFHQPQPDLDLRQPGPTPVDYPTASRSKENASFFSEEEGEEESDNVYGVVDVMRGKRRRPPRRRPTPEEEGAAATSEQPEAPPRPHFRTLASVQEEECGEGAVDVFADVP